MAEVIGVSTKMEENKGRDEYGLSIRVTNPWQAGGMHSQLPCIQESQECKACHALILSHSDNFPEGHCQAEDHRHLPSTVSMG